MNRLYRLNQLLFLLFFLTGFVFIHVSAQPNITVDLNKKGAGISPSHYGVFFEDINHAADGGLYAELIRNRSFEDAATPENWDLMNFQGATSSYSIETKDLLNKAQSRALKLKVTGLPASNSYSRLSNQGFWGMKFEKGKSYKVSFFAKCDTVFGGEVRVAIEDELHQVLAEKTISGIGGKWQKFSCELVAGGNAERGAFVIIPQSTGTVWFDVVSLFPPTFKKRENGLRPDLAQLIADLQPKFLRFPGGCFVEGDVLANRFDWKKTIGNIEDRPGHYNLWGYRTSDGLGYHEYLQLCEDVNADPMFVVNIGVAHNDFKPYNSIDEYIEEALDAIEYANGSTTTKYGAMRAAAGHPGPFNLKYIEVGNENFNNDHYGERYIQFYNAIKSKYPEIEIIGNVAAWGTDNPEWPFPHPVDLVDEHYYRNPEWFIHQYTKYDNYSRSKPKIYVGEYAVTQNAGLGNLAAAIGEAVYMCGMEKNPDVVRLNSYAPMFVNVNDRRWNPDLINFSASKVYCTPSYYVQKMFANNIGTVNLEITDSLNVSRQRIAGAIGVGTWLTGAEYDNVKVTGQNGEALIDDAFSSSANWSVYNGNWTIQSGAYTQTSLAEDCRSVTSWVADSSYTYTLRARKKNGAEGFLIIFGYQDSDNFYWWNLGGWGNTRHAVERAMGGSKTIMTEVPGSIQTNVWYDIKIEVTPARVKCYLNNQLIQSFEIPEQRLLYTAASVNEDENMVFLKVVNPSDLDVEANFNIHGTNAPSLNGEVITLTSFSKTDENSLDFPQRVYPVTKKISVQPSFKKTIPANSVNVFKFRTDDVTGLNRAKKMPEPAFHILPNPVDEQLFVHLEKTGNATVEIFNAAGICVLNREIENNQQLEVSALKPGLYLFCAEGLGTQKFVKR